MIKFKMHIYISLFSNYKDSKEVFDWITFESLGILNDIQISMVFNCDSNNSLSGLTNE